MVLLGGMALMFLISLLRRKPLQPAMQYAGAPHTAQLLPDGPAVLSPRPDSRQHSRRFPGGKLPAQRKDHFHPPARRRATARIWMTSACTRRPGNVRGNLDANAGTRRHPAKNRCTCGQWRAAGSIRRQRTCNCQRALHRPTARKQRRAGRRGRNLACAKKPARQPVGMAAGRYSTDCPALTRHVCAAFCSGIESPAHAK